MYIIDARFFFYHEPFKLLSDDRLFNCKPSSPIEVIRSFSGADKML